MTITLTANMTSSTGSSTRGHMAALHRLSQQPPRAQQAHGPSPLPDVVPLHVARGQRFRRFAAQLRGGPKDTTFKFDDVGCLVFWLEEQRARFPWMDDATTRMWVAAWESPSAGEAISTT